MLLHDGAAAVGTGTDSRNGPHLRAEGLAVLLPVAAHERGDILRTTVLCQGQHHGELQLQP